MKSIKVIDRDLLKYIGFVPMVLGHIVLYLLSAPFIQSWPAELTNFILYAEFLGVPIFMFFISEGFMHTRSQKKYALRLLIFAFITQIAHTLADHGMLITIELFSKWNVFMTLFWGLVGLNILNHKQWKIPIRITGFVLVVLITALLRCEWMIYGPLIILGFYLWKQRPLISFLWYFACIYIYYAIGLSDFLFIFRQINFMFIALILSYILIKLFYNGKPGKFPKCSKWFFYIGYPLHYILIWILKYIV